MNGVIRAGHDRSLCGGATVTLHAAGGEVLASVKTREDGSFSFEPRVSAAPPPLYYTRADLGHGVILMAILGFTIPAHFIINELTTVAAAYSSAQCLNGGIIEGSTLALSIVAAMNANLVDVATGTPSSVITMSPNGDQTNACRSLNSLANLLVTAVEDRGKALQSLFKLTTRAPWPEPDNTVAAMLNLVRKPTPHAGGIYTQSKLGRVYSPVLTAQPAAWTIAVKVNNSGDDTRMFGGPGSIDFDSRGNAWIPNNVAQGTPNSSKYSIVLDLAGRPLAVSPFEGGGLRGAGFGVAVDNSDNVWFGNFGWGDDKPEEGGVSKFSPNATPISPEPYGYTQGGMNRVQGTVVDRRTGNVWTAGWGNGTVVCYRGGRHDDYAVYTDNSGTFSPFGIAIAPDGSAWVTNSDASASSVLHLELGSGRTINRLLELPLGKVLKGIQIDSSHNIWVASGGDDHVYVVDRDGHVLGGYQGGGINGPWGIMLDGDDNLWVGNFGPLEVGTVYEGCLTQLAGANADGYRMGDGMTPQSGYTLPSEGAPVLLADNNPLYGPDAPPSYIPMMRTTGLNIDAAGNVWTCNNWKPNFVSDAIDDPFAGQANPGGDGILIWLGIAKPKS